MVQEDSHSTLRARADNSSRRLCRSGMAGDHWLVASAPMLASESGQKISNNRDNRWLFGIKPRTEANFRGFIPMHALDAIDRKILGQLQADSRTTMQELADKVGLSISPCHRRVKLLEERGGLARYMAVV